MCAVLEVLKNVYFIREYYNKSINTKLIVKEKYIYVCNIIQL